MTDTGGDAMTAETPAEAVEAPASPTPSSGLLVGVEPISSVRRQYSPESDGIDSHSYGHGEGMATWLRQLTVSA